LAVDHVFELQARTTGAVAHPVSEQERWHAAIAIGLAI
jgi:hypothetical protein